MGSKFGRLSSLARGPSAQTLATSVAAQALTVISGVIAARALGVEGRGTLAILWLIPVTLVLLGGIGIPQATTFYVAREIENARGVVRISVRITVLLAVGPVRGLRRRAARFRRRRGCLLDRSRVSSASGSSRCSWRRTWGSRRCSGSSGTGLSTSAGSARSSSTPLDS